MNIFLRKMRRYFYNENEKKKNREGNGIIYIPLDYFKEWSSHTTVCNPPYDWLSWACNILVFKFYTFIK